MVLILAIIYISSCSSSSILLHTVYLHVPQAIIEDIPTEEDKWTQNLLQKAIGVNAPSVDEICKYKAMLKTNDESVKCTNLQIPQAFQ